MTRAKPWQLIFFFLQWFVLQLYEKFRKIKSYEEINVINKVAVITGANSGIGKYVATELAKRGACIIMACRNIEEAEKVKAEIKRNSGSEHVYLLQLDLGELKSIHDFANNVKKKFPKVDILINNAGVSLNCPQLQKTKDGFELHMGVNYLGHFLLTNLLLDQLKKAQESRVINVASTTACMSNFDVDDIMMEKATSLGLGNTMPYNNSKYAMITFSKELERRMGGGGIHSFAVCPGLARSQIFRNYSPIAKFFVDLTLSTIGLSIPRACNTVLYCALDKNICQHGGFMYRFGGRFRAIEMILDEDLGPELWDNSEELVGIN